MGLSKWVERALNLARVCDVSTNAVYMVVSPLTGAREGYPFASDVQYF